MFSLLWQYFTLTLSPLLLDTISFGSPRSISPSRASGSRSINHLHSPAVMLYVPKSFAS